MRKILIIDDLHPAIIPPLENSGWKVDYMPTITQAQVPEIIGEYTGLILRSKIFIGKEVLEKAEKLRFVARAGAGMDQIVEEEVKKRGIILLNAPEGNCNAVAEHVLGMILTLFNRLNTANTEVKNGIWQREANRGYELNGKTVAIIGYGHNGKAFAKKLTGFECKVLAYDILPTAQYINSHAQPATMEQIFEQADVVSLHVPLTPLTENMVNHSFIHQFKKNIWLFNTSRGKVVVLNDLLDAMDKGKIIGAGLDVLENENLESFQKNQPDLHKKLMNNPKILLTPHVAGWTFESHEKISQTLAQKINALKF